MSDKTIRISSREVLELLGGTVSTADLTGAIAGARRQDPMDRPTRSRARSPAER
jgi:hypothetical protein